VNSQLKLRKALPERLRALGLDEMWLQAEIARDSSLLGLGEVELLRKEKTQPSGGRIDLIMAEPGAGVRYEIEVMLGETDPSHIIRTIEYWDVERQRYPTLKHRAVIVAEEITARFFNVIRLLNRAVPIIAIQLSAFRFGDEVVLQFTRVLDTSDTGEEPDDEDGAEPVDRGYWEKKNKEALAVVEVIKGLPRGEPKITYNKYHIALGTTGYNFCWFYPRKANCHIEIKVGAEKRQTVIDQLEAAGIETSTNGRGLVGFHARSKDVEEHRQILADIIQGAEEWSNR